MQHLVNCLPNFSVNNNNITVNPKINSPDHSNTISYNSVGNFVPPEWKNLTNLDGKVLSKTAKQLLSLIVYRLQVVGCKSQDQDELQESYQFFQEELGVCQRRVRQCLVELTEGKFISQELRTVVFNRIKCHNILCIKLIKNFVNINKESHNNDQTNITVNSKIFSGEPEINFSQGRKNFQLHNNIDNIYKKNISKSRYSKSDFLKNNFEEADSVTVIQQTTSDNSEDSSVGVSKIADKPKWWCSNKKLEEFYPLTEDDASILQVQSNREFGLSYINKLLQKLAETYPENRFYNKSAVLKYMTKALMYELREANMVNNIDFNFGLSSEIKTKEKYLQQVESSTHNDQRTSMRRKIAAVFDRDTAYSLLTSCRWVGVNDDKYRLELLQQINLSEAIKNRILNEIQAIYGNMVQELQVMPYSQIKTTKQLEIANLDQAKTPYSGLNHLNPESSWYKVRQHLIDKYSKYTDRNWFSKIEVVEEDKTNRKIKLKTTSSFVAEWIMQNYQNALEDAFKTQDFTFEIIPARLDTT